MSQPSLTPPKLRLPVNVQPVRYRVSLHLTPGQDQFNGHIAIDLKVLDATPVIWLNARSLQFQSGSIRAGDIQQPARLQPSGENFVAIIMDRPLQPGSAQLEIDYTGEVSRTLTDEPSSNNAVMTGISSRNSSR